MNADEFNALYEVGIPVFAYPGCRPEDGADTRLVTRTRSRASVLGGHTDVVWVDGHSACIALSHVDPVTEEQFAKARAEETAAAVAAEGALPVPVDIKPLAPQGRPHTMLDRARDALNARMTKDNLRLVLENVITHAVALNDRIAELEAERHTTNEALSDAAETIRANRDRIAELEKVAVEARAALGALCYDLEDPGSNALGALYLLTQATVWTEAGPDDAADALAQHDAEIWRQAARLLEETGRDDDAVNLLDNVAAGIVSHATLTPKEA